MTSNRVTQEEITRRMGLKPRRFRTAFFDFKASNKFP